MTYTGTLKNQQQKSLMDKISKTLIESKSKSNHSIITKALNWVVSIAIITKYGSKCKKGNTVLVVRILHKILKKTTE